MQELIKVTTNEQGSEVVSGRELYEFLGMNKDFTNWYKNMFDYGFAEGKDYILIYAQKGVNSGRGRKRVDYALTIDTAKEIAMLSRTEKGKQARQYFIECERIAKQRQQAKPLTQLEMMAQMIQVNIEQEKALKALQHDQKEIKEKLQEIDIRTLTCPESFTVAGFAANIKKQITLQQAKILGMKAKKICRERGVEIGKISDPRFGKIGVYPKDILKEVFNYFFQFEVAF